MNKRKIDLDPVPLDDEERDMIEAMDAAFDRGDIPNALTPERKAEVEASARATLLRARRTHPKSKSLRGSLSAT